MMEAILSMVQTAVQAALPVQQSSITQEQEGVSENVRTGTQGVNVELPLLPPVECLDTQRDPQMIQFSNPSEYPAVSSPNMVQDTHRDPQILQMSQPSEDPAVSSPNMVKEEVHGKFQCITPHWTPLPDTWYVAVTKEGVLRAARPLKMFEDKQVYEWVPEIQVSHRGGTDSESYFYKSIPFSKGDAELKKSPPVLDPVDLFHFAAKAVHDKRTLVIRSDPAYSKPHFRFELEDNDMITQMLDQLPAWWARATVGDRKESTHTASSGFPLCYITNSAKSQLVGPFLAAEKVTNAHKQLVFCCQH